ncbi:MAG: MarC family protein [Verrucomicrobia bacterium]|nr:MarC family protein [Verrucomicrobiota bacterium]
MEATLTTIAVPIFFVLNATGQIPLFLALLARFDQKRQLRIITRELVIALVLLLLFTFFGDWILRMLGISKPIISVAGGILLFLISLGMIFPKEEKPKEHLTQEPMIIPLAIPVITGPGAISTVMTYSHETGDPFLVASAAFLAWIPSLIILLLGSYIKNILGERGLVAVERLGGMLVCLIGSNMFTSGILNLVSDYFKLQ